VSQPLLQLPLKFASLLVLGHEMRLKISNRNSSLGNISSKLGEPKILTQAGALFLLALAHESAKAKAFEPLTAVQQLLGERKAAPLADEGAQTLAAEFEDLITSWTGTIPDTASLDEAFEAIAHMSASDSQVVLAQSGTNRAPVSDAAVDYIDPTRFAPMKEATSLQSVPAPVASQAAPLADDDALALKLEPELLLDPNALAATSAGPLLLPVPLLLGAGAVALAGGGLGGSGGGSGSGTGGSTQPVNNPATIISEPGKDGGSVTTVAQKATGKFSVQDADAGQAGMQAQSNVAGKYGTFNLAADGTWAYELNPNLDAFKALPKDVTGKDSFTVKSRDGSAEKTVSVDVKGINDAPIITSSAQTGVVQEDGTLTATGQVVATDVDTTATLTYSCAETSMTSAQQGLYGTLSLNAVGAWTYNLDNAAVQNFKSTTIADDVFKVYVRDEFGALASQTVTLKITGNNDAPVVTDMTPALDARKIQETPSQTGVQKNHVLTGTFKVSDVDAASLSEISLSKPTSSSPSFGGELVLSGINLTTGLVNWTYQISDAKLDSLASGNNVTDTQSFDVSDGFVSSKISSDVLLLGADTTLV
jgi:VCBS repeat-containing protein